MPPNVGRVTVREVAEQWLALQATRVRPRTLDNYERGLRLRVLPTFGARRIDSITSRDVEKWVAELGPVMPGTVKHAIFPLPATLNDARKHGLIQSNPCEVVDRPKRLPTGREKRKGHFLSGAQVAAGAARVAESEPVYGLLVRFAAGVGLRRSEIAGLRVRDLRLARREVHVERMAERTYPGGVRIVQEPKSARSRRRVPILDDELLHESVSRWLGHHSIAFTDAVYAHVAGTGLHSCYRQDPSCEGERVADSRERRDPTVRQVDGIRTRACPGPMGSGEIAPRRNSNFVSEVGTIVTFA